MLGGGIFVFVLQILWSLYKGKAAGKDPWDARTVEWMVDSPPKPYNFKQIPVIKSRDQFWENKYGNPANHSEEVPEGDHGIHMPDRSWYPFLLSFSLFVLGFGFIFLHNDIPLFGLIIPHDIWIPLLGAGMTLITIIGWALEGPGGYHLHPDENDPETT